MLPIGSVSRRLGNFKEHNAPYWPSMQEIQGYKEQFAPYFGQNVWDSLL